jgi:hypothetical protein
MRELAEYLCSILHVILELMREENIGRILLRFFIERKSEQYT